MYGDKQSWLGDKEGQEAGVYCSLEWPSKTFKVTLDQGNEMRGQARWVAGGMSILAISHIWCKDSETWPS